MKLIRRTNVCEDAIFGWARRGGAEKKRVVREALGEAIYGRAIEVIEVSLYSDVCTINFQIASRRVVEHDVILHILPRQFNEV